LIEFAQGVEWEKRKWTTEGEKNVPDTWTIDADDAEVIELLKSIKKRAEEMDEVRRLPFCRLLFLTLLNQGDDDEDTDRRAKVVVVGDGAVGMYTRGPLSVS
jgi:hypothetical protein